MKFKDLKVGGMFYVPEVKWDFVKVSATEACTDDPQNDSFWGQTETFDPHVEVEVQPPELTYEQWIVRR